MASPKDKNEEEILERIAALISNIVELAVERRDALHNFLLVLVLRGRHGSAFDCWRSSCLCVCGRLRRGLPLRQSFHSDAGECVEDAC